MDDMSWYRKAGFEAHTTLATRTSWLSKTKCSVSHDQNAGKLIQVKT